MNESQLGSTQPRFRAIAMALTLYLVGFVIVAIDLILDTQSGGTSFKFGLFLRTGETVNMDELDLLHDAMGIVLQVIAMVLLIRRHVAGTFRLLLILAAALCSARLILPIVEQTGVPIPAAVARYAWIALGLEYVLFCSAMAGLCASISFNGLARIWKFVGGWFLALHVLALVIMATAMTWLTFGPKNPSRSWEFDLAPHANLGIVLAVLMWILIAGPFVLMFFQLIATRMAAHSAATATAKSE